MLSQLIRNQIQAYIEWDDEMLPLFDEDKPIFLEWLFENANTYNISNTMNQGILDLDNIISGRCYGNSQYISENYNKTYAEGFILREGMYIPHGFNIGSTHVEDYTLYKTLRGRNLPDEYYGVIIPERYLSEENYDGVQSRSLMIEYWTDSR